ncbi:DUF2188 domain-containing protein [Mycoplasmopsis cynos]|uniref:DUF2188 domain-containing protein n=1 Tax=Mycoplasmopsis cynos TaxID=171284 RepID=A0ABD8AIQ7_9BACT|nr:DUF2188 domain-containing protein [Mycoplasmopsis cynos]MCU9932741.1 DUF2188 domain-containing protein [Mycoplasmopsis cynos]UWV80568.1 DUF2188 domain-containing protein [Mycoplasmopsis cynos]UWV81251.1 DUF2188 domain-containing protein [Mycoplasmopsis cynos]UWV92590.1 DUF2188 domain-containing protein [Mycoplasmopsis cynos]WAM05002.1 DUF2188 domain-containing protein [Mycoplasmopsis cynos]
MENKEIKKDLKPIWHITKDKEKDKWRVYREGAERATILFETQKEAIPYARDLAKKNNGTYYIHGENGKIRDGKGYNK